MPAVIILIVLIAADQLLKWWTVSHLALGESAPLIPGVIQLTRLHNTGAAWSSFSGKTALLTAVTLVLMAAVAVLLVKKIVRHRLGVAACLLILGGIVALWLAMELLAQFWGWVLLIVGIALVWWCAVIVYRYWWGRRF